jgi:hypothetical protein
MVYKSVESLIQGQLAKNQSVQRVSWRTKLTLMTRLQRDRMQIGRPRTYFLPPKKHLSSLTESSIILNSSRLTTEVTYENKTLGLTCSGGA